MGVSDNIRKAREAKGLSQPQLASLVGVDVNTVWRWEKAKASPASPTLSKIAIALNTTVAYLLGETDDPDPRQGLSLWDTLMAANSVPPPLNGQELLVSVLEKLGMGADEIKSVLGATQRKEDILSRIAEDPQKMAIVKMLVDMDENQTRKSYEYISDQKRIIEQNEELRKLKKGA
jgi:transcriptional regulator with XRE-family HTH domain